MKTTTTTREQWWEPCETCLPRVLAPETSRERSLVLSSCPLACFHCLWPGGPSSSSYLILTVCACHQPPLLLTLHHTPLSGRSYPLTTPVKGSGSREIPGSPVIKLGTLTVVAQFQSLVRELRSCKLCRAAKKKKKRICCLPFVLSLLTSKSPQNFNNFHSFSLMLSLRISSIYRASGCTPSWVTPRYSSPTPVWLLTWLPAQFTTISRNSPSISEHPIATRSQLCDTANSSPTRLILMC